MDICYDTLNYLLKTEKFKSHILKKLGLKSNGSTIRFLDKYIKDNGVDFEVQRKPPKIKLCKNCENDFKPKYKSQVFCSKSCSATFTNIKKYKICIGCNKSFHSKNSKTKYCAQDCWNKTIKREYINKWLNNEIDPTNKNGYGLSTKIRNYLLEINKYKCQMCGWGEINKTSKKVPLHIHHIDGDCSHNYDDNLQVLCPNCHSLTENFGSLNKNSKRFFRSKIK